MRADAEIIKVNGMYAIAKAQRTPACSSCAGCSEKGGCGAHLIFGEQTENVELEVYNGVGAKVGDFVELGSSTAKTLLVSLAVFVLPVLLSVLGYFVAAHFTGDEYIPAAVLVIVFVLSFAAASAVMNVYAKKHIRIEVVRILEEREEERTGDEYSKG